MTKRIFDVENEKDMTDLWDTLHDDVYKITKQTYNDNYDLLWYNNEETSKSPFNINWHDKTEITRPIQQATKADIGKLCAFWNNAGLNAIGVLSNIYNGENDNYKMSYGGYWEHCRRLTKQEIEELC